MNWNLIFKLFTFVLFAYYSLYTYRQTNYNCEKSTLLQEFFAFNNFMYYAWFYTHLVILLAFSNLTEVPISLAIIGAIGIQVFYFFSHISNQELDVRNSTLLYFEKSTFRVALLLNLLLIGILTVIS